MAAIAYKEETVCCDEVGKVTGPYPAPRETGNCKRESIL